MAFSASAIHINKHPCEGGKFVRVTCDFAQVSQVNVDLQVLIGLGGIQDLQTAFIDAWGADEDVMLTMRATRQRIICPANSQGIFPVFFRGDSGQFVVDCADDQALVKVFITNQPCIVPCVWPNRSSPGSKVLRDSDGNIIRDSDGNPILGS